MIKKTSSVSDRHLKDMPIRVSRPNPISDSPTTDSPPTVAFDPIHWALANPWLSEGQATDRTPMDGSVADSGGPPSEQRAFARRSHQAMFKKWSQARHD